MPWLELIHLDHHSVSAPFGVDQSLHPFSYFKVKTPPAKTVGSTPAKTIEAKLTPAKSIDVKSPPAKMETTTTPAKKAGPLTKSTPVKARLPSPLALYRHRLIFFQEKASASPKPTPSSEVASTPSGKKLTPMKKK